MRRAVAVSPTQLAAEARELFDRGDHEQAFVLIEQARKEVKGPPIEVDRLRLFAAEILIFLQRPEEALPLTEAPLASGSQGLKPRQLMLRGGALRRREVARARSFLDEALAAATTAEDHRTEAMCWIYLGQIRLETGRDSSHALEAYRRAEALATAAGDASLQAIAKLNVGRSLIDLLEFDLAIDAFRTVAASAANQRNPALRAFALENLAICYLKVGDPERALQVAEQSNEIIERLARPLARVISRGTRGLLLWGLGRHDEAIGFLRGAAALARDLGEAPELRRRLDDLVDPLIRLGRVEEAEARSAEVFALYEKEPELAAKVRSQSLYRRALVHEARGRRLQARDDLHSAIRGANPEDTDLRRDSQFALARLAAAADQREEARKHFEAAIRLAEAERAGLQTEDSQLTFLETTISIYREYAALLSKWGDEPGALRVEESSRARLVANRVSGPAPPVRIAELRQLAARSRTVFLAYWIGTAGTSHVRVIDPERYERVPLQIDPARLAALVRQHNDLIELQLADPRKEGLAAEELYRLLVAPVAARIPAGGRVVVIPDAALHRLNFESLVRGRAGQKGFWLEDVTLQVAPSLAMLQEGAAPTLVPRRRLLLMGDALAAPDFARLDHSRDEMKAVREVFGPAEVTERAGAEAMPSAFAAANPSAFSHIHFSAHALANRESPLDSAVILSPDQEGASRGRYQLRARDVAKVRLAADMVTVSACRSAGDRAVQGEGMVGFAWAFLRAGAGNVVAGLWDVNDRSTTDLMKKLYAQVKAGASATEALRRAKLDLVQAGGNNAKPYYWAPFQVYSRSLRAR